MPVIKPIPGHTSVRGVQRYLERDGRALATDLLNLSWDEDLDRDSDPELKKAVDWAAEMDMTRAAYGNDAPWHGKRARTYMHFVLSPDPKDRVTLPRLQELARAWCRENWGDFECAIVYHDDNDGEIMHAHVVVNNTSLSTGRRLQNPDPRAMQRSIQRLASQRGMSFFVDQPEGDPASREGAAVPPPRTRQQVYVRRAEREIEGKGGYSWVSDIRSRVQIAKGLAANPGEFVGILGAMEVEVGEASPKGGRRDWVYSLRDHPTWRIRGENLGLVYGRKAVEGSLRANVPLAASARELAASALELKDFGQLERLARTLEAQGRYGIRSLADYRRRIEAMERRGDEAAASDLREAYAFASGHGLLPESPPDPKRNPLLRDERRREALGGEEGRGPGGFAPASRHRDIPERSSDDRSR
ncbi:relaxase/mobilization nuclease domain-containing protein [Eggerthella sp.]|uniref:relaxase/mobilization nuclease domain-containing protein n=1 Tax=Eggerthellaceae TaxID=1643826 RepID=UPI0028509614|nr:relaxase/mobilization nuclease domain-containing protein [Eggerthella sp.]MDR3847667.1 relaxase/mobilization nuclease domain-containing protein [Eggerthella sp.]